MNETQQHILELVKTYPRHFSQKIKADTELYAVVHDEECSTLSEMAYRTVYPNQPKMCTRGNTKKFKSFQEGYGFCGATKQCECARISVSESVSRSKSTVTIHQQQQINHKRADTNLKKYGVTNTAQIQKAKERHRAVYSDRDTVERIQQQIAATKTQRYGDAKYNNSHKIKSTWNHKKQQYFTEKYPEKDLETLIDPHDLSHLFEKHTPEHIAALLNVHPQIVYRHLYNHNLRSKFCSMLVQQMMLWLHSMNVTNVVTSSDKILNSGRTLDIYLPDHNVAIDINGMYWHHDTVPHIDRYYHKNKFTECAELRIQLITVFSDLWESKSHIIKNMIAHKLNLCTRKVGARQLEIRPVSSAQAREFFSEHHIQSYAPSSYRYGLWQQDQLLAAMTFSKPRTGIGKMRAHTAELVRYASSVTVAGGAGRLLKHFMKTHPEFTQIISYSDNEWSTGALYQKLGFQLLTDHLPSYFYYHRSVGRKHRYNFAKHKLIQQGESSEKSESEIMSERGFLRVWDCGKKTWLYTVNESSTG